MFHKILESSCKAEESKLGTAQHLASVISLFCILSWRGFRMTMLNRSAANSRINWTAIAVGSPKGEPAWPADAHWTILRPLRQI